MFMRNTNARGRLTTAISPSVAAMPTRATDQKSATISEIQRSHSCQTNCADVASRCIRRNAGRSEADQVQQRRRLVPDLVHQRRRDAGADHALARDADDGDRVLAAAWHARARAPDRGADVAVEVADDRRRLVVAGQRQRVGGDHVEAGQPHAGFVLAALRDDVGEGVELDQRDVELETQDGEAPLRLLVGGVVVVRPPCSQPR